MIYQTFAQLYDELFDDQLYADWPFAWPSRVFPSPMPI